MEFIIMDINILVNFPDQWAILFAFTDEQNKQEHPEYEEIVRKLGRRI